MTTSEAQMSEAGRMAADLARKLFDGLFWPQGVRQADPDWPQHAWDQIEDSGLTLALVPESAGGYELDKREALELIRMAGAAAVPLPFGETMIANWLLARAGIASPGGPLALVLDGAPDRASGHEGSPPPRRFKRVPWARHANHAVVALEADGEAKVALVPRERFHVESTMENHAGEPRDTLILDGAFHAEAAAAGLGMRDLMGCAVSMRTVAIAGILDAVLERTVSYATERVQFGRPISNFQAIQHQLAVMAGHWAMASAAAQLAADAFGDPQQRVEAASAKVVADEAAGAVAGIAHQVHGAIGFSREHPLHVFTTRLWSWRDDYGNGSDWSREVGRAAIAAGTSGLWPMIVGKRGAHAAA